MNRFVGVVCVAGVLAVAGAAASEQWVDYAPAKGFWSVTNVKVDPRYVDDYLTALRKNWVPGEELAKRHGLVDRYMVQVRFNAAGEGANVRLIEHIPSASMFEPNRERDLQIQAEARAMMPRERENAVREEYGKYRTIMSEELWQDVDFMK